ncbi:Urmylation protein, variant 2 [Puccinia graminis f. sp. tritici]|uniref:Urmylation protein n=1 Tax=Puccinia graminis f. sp. tritici TaxID=56615 RepID=A0A5B0NTP0_PUCGR|nr:Urmylation protein [Puccinia graminis f. sp. tritici]KAA1091480.1 Urmylation protein, variant 2 [Puccinia graminis f. sp. tritici]
MTVTRNLSCSNFTSHSGSSRPIEEIAKEIKQTNAKLLQLQLELSHALKSQKVDSLKQDSLPLDDYIRYGRQMIVSQVGLTGQLKLKKASVLVIGAGGLGCPALLYLVRAGVGNVSIVDHDTVELSNLHRQVLHTDSTVGLNKAESARINLLAGNPSVRITAYPMPFLMSRMSNPSKEKVDDSTPNLLPDISQFSLVLDCTDNPASRYLISDACAAYGIPLVSGAAIRTEGQLAVWNLPPPSGSSHDRGPCYRCIFPETDQIRVERCADEGVLGPAVGVVGVLMAWEVIRLLIGIHDLTPKLLLVPSFRSIKLRKAKKDCLGCSAPSKTAFLERIRVQPSGSHGEASSEVDTLSNACSMGSQQPVIQTSTERITANDLLSNKYQLNQFRLLDVRPRTQFEICALPNSINIPITEALENPESTIERLRKVTHNALKNEDRTSALKNQCDWLVVCRRGNDSLLAADALNSVISASTPHREQDHTIKNEKFMDLVGGLETYSLVLDPTFPLY